MTGEHHLREMANSGQAPAPDQPADPVSLCL